MAGRRLFVGKLPYRATHEDIEHFFRGYGKIKDIDIKSGYCFVELGSSRDADDAVHDLDRRTLCGEKVTVELARAPGGRMGGDRFERGPRFERGGNLGNGNNRFGPPERTPHRVLVENLSSRISWQSLKDIFRRAGEVSFADAHKSRPNEAIVEFTSRADMKSAVEKFDGYELSGRRLKVYEDKGDDKRRSRSRSIKSRSSRSNSRSRSHSNASRSASSKSRSKTPVKISASKSEKRKRRSSRSISPSPVNRSNKRLVASRSPSAAESVKKETENTKNGDSASNSPQSDRKQLKNSRENSVTSEPEYEDKKSPKREESVHSRSSSRREKSADSRNSYASHASQEVLAEVHSRSPSVRSEEGNSCD